MTAQDLYDGMSRAVEAAKPAQEYCLKVLDQQWWTCLTKAEWSGWMQAISSVAAIGIAAFCIVWQVGKQAKQATRERIEEDVRRLQSVAFALFMVRIEIERWKANIADIEASKPPVLGIFKAVDRLASIPILDLPNWAANHAVSKVVVALALVRDAITSEPGNPSLEDLKPQLLSRITDFATAVEDARADVENSLRQLGGFPPSMTVPVGGKVLVLGIPPDCEDVFRSKK
ncbi:MAG: hypothetical protein EOP24_39535 [Hyphomicrobiales bacterium]|nr:MAG: hypothetical protein EOP24_39535 [Hyphomicrobiales bacterium]